MLEQKTEYEKLLPANKHSGSDLYISFHTNLPCENVVFLNIEYKHGQNDFAILKVLSVRCAAKKVDWWSYKIKGVE